MAGRMIRTWILVVLGLVLAALVFVVAIAGAGFYFFRQHIQTQQVSAATATRDFERVRARFAGQKPLVELDRHGNFVKSNVDRTSPHPGRVPEQLSVLAFDADDGRVVKVSVPFWLLRLKTRGGSIDFNGGRMNLEDLKLSVEDLERFGPALIVDYTSSDGNRVLVWSQ